MKGGKVDPDVLKSSDNTNRVYSMQVLFDSVNVIGLFPILHSKSIMVSPVITILFSTVITVLFSKYRMCRIGDSSFKTDS